MAKLSRTEGVICRLVLDLKGLFSLSAPEVHGPVSPLFNKLVFSTTSRKRSDDVANSAHPFVWQFYGTTVCEFLGRRVGDSGILASSFGAQGQAGGEKQLTTTLQGSPAGATLFSALPWGRFPRIPQPCSSCGVSSIGVSGLDVFRVASAAMCPAAVFRVNLCPSTSRASGMCPKPCPSFGS